jgi:tRNA pseudouridine55 synthase
VHRIELVSYVWPRIEVEIECGSGTFIRSIARDVGETLGCGGFVEELVRTCIGPFTLADALDPQTLSAAELPERLLPPIEALVGLPSLRLTAAELSSVSQGRPIRPDHYGGGLIPPGEVALLGPDDTLVAVAEHDPGSGQVFPRRVFVNQS